MLQMLSYTEIRNRLRLFPGLSGTEGSVSVRRVIVHPNYNTNALKHKAVREFYDYDVALLETNSSIPLSWSAR